ncbi:MAG: YkgJ family cysteine cluster protein, partial [Candidatus Eisenbacteria bacterium]
AKDGRGRKTSAARPSAVPVAALTASDEDGRDPLQLSASENADLCAGCTRCCDTVSIEIDAPRSAWEYDQWVWVLHHRSLEVYVEKPERWFLHIETRCNMLNEQGRCSIHGRHPILCREYDPRVCERRLPLLDIVAWFKDAGELESWLAAKRPAHWKRLLDWRKSKIRAGEKANARRVKLPAAALIQIAEAGGAGHEPATHLPERKVARKRR